MMERKSRPEIVQETVGERVLAHTKRACGTGEGAGP